ncbi:MAG: hypothetical protein AAFW81_08905 [Pseudomonadota bacterium]
MNAMFVCIAMTTAASLQGCGTEYSDHQVLAEFPLDSETTDAIVVWANDANMLNFSLRQRLIRFERHDVDGVFLSTDASSGVRFGFDDRQKFTICAPRSKITNSEGIAFINESFSGVRILDSLERCPTPTFQSYTYNPSANMVE